MRGCLQAFAVRKTRNKRDGPGYHLAPLHQSARLARLGVATR